MEVLPKILVVEDSPTIRKAISSILCRNNYNVLTACDGKDAMNVLRNENPELIISDIMMPNMNGYELYRNLRNIPRLNTVPFIFLTALNDEVDVWSGKELGVDDYITKPFKKEDILSAVKGKLKRMSQLREDTYKELESLKKEIIMTLSHEFKTPLTVIQGFTSLLLRDDISLNEKQLREFLNYIKAGGERLGELINDFVCTMEIDSGIIEREISIMRGNNDINCLLRVLFERYAQEAFDKNIDFTIEDGKDLPLVNISLKHVSLAMEKIIDNAFKFTGKEKSVVIMKSFLLNDNVSIEIKDNGPGIPPGEIENIFKKFYQIERRKTEQTGAGLGLTIARRFIELNNGTISVKSEVEKGCIFLVSFPVI